MKILPLLLMLCLMVVPAQAALDQPLADPVLEARAVAIGNQLRCAVCQSESINDSQAEFARDMRKLVRAFGRLPSAAPHGHLVPPTARQSLTTALRASESLSESPYFQPFPGHPTYRPWHRPELAVTNA